MSSADGRMGSGPLDRDGGLDGGTVIPAVYMFRSYAILIIAANRREEKEKTPSRQSPLSRRSASQERDRRTGTGCVASRQPTLTRKRIPTEGNSTGAEPRSFSAARNRRFRRALIQMITLIHRGPVRDSATSTLDAMQRGSSPGIDAGQPHCGAGPAVKLPLGFPCRRRAYGVCRLTALDESCMTEAMKRPVQYSGERVLTCCHSDASAGASVQVPDEPFARGADADVLPGCPVLGDDGTQHRLQRDLRDIPPFGLGNGSGMLVEVPDLDWRAWGVERREMTFQLLPDNAPAVPARQNVDTMRPCLGIDQLVVPVSVPEGVVGKGGGRQGLMRSSQIRNMLVDRVVAEPPVLPPFHRRAAHGAGRGLDLAAAPPLVPFADSPDVCRSLQRDMPPQLVGDRGEDGDASAPQVLHYGEIASGRRMADQIGVGGDLRGGGRGHPSSPDLIAAASSVSRWSSASALS